MVKGGILIDTASLKDDRKIKKKIYILYLKTEIYSKRTIFDYNRNSRKNLENKYRFTILGIFYLYTNNPIRMKFFG
jgi:hypothetical protein